MSIKINSSMITNNYFKSVNANSASTQKSAPEDSDTITTKIKVVSKNIVPKELSTYVSDIKNDSKDMMETITKLYKNCSDGNEKEMYRSMKKFTNCYNNIVDTNKEYLTDEGVKKLTKKLKKLVENNSDEFEDMGITLKSNGKLSVNETKLLSAAEDGTLSDFLSSNKDSIIKKSFMDEVRKISRKIYRDQTTFLSDKSKEILQNPIITYTEEINNDAGKSDVLNASSGNTESRESSSNTLGDNLDINA